MRLLAIGDVHGCSAALDRLLESLRLQAGDTLIFLGDYVDRGPDSAGVLDRLSALEAREDIELVALLGNHDQMMLEARAGKAQDWLHGYGVPTLASYPGQNLEAVPESHWEFLARCREFYETPGHIFVHANLHADQAPEEADAYVLRWEKLRESNSQAHSSGKTLICGHASQKNGGVLDLGHAICIDTYAYGGQWLTCLDVTTRQIWRASQNGEVEEGVLPRVRSG